MPGFDLNAASLDCMTGTVVAVRPGDTAAVILTFRDTRPADQRQDPQVVTVVATVPTGERITVPGPVNINVPTDGEAPVVLNFATTRAPWYSLSQGTKPGCYTILVTATAANQSRTQVVQLRVGRTGASALEGDDYVMTLTDWLAAFFSWAWLFFATLFLLCSIYSLWPPPPQDQQNPPAISGPAVTDPPNPTAEGFTITLPGNTINIQRGFSTIVGLSVKAVGKSAHTIKLTASVTPSGPDAQLRVTEVNLQPPTNAGATQAEAGLVVDAKPTIAPRAYSLKISAIEGNVSHAIVANINVREPGSIPAVLTHPAKFVFVGKTLIDNPDFSDEKRLMLIVSIAAALGGTLYGLRSMVLYIGHRQLVASWFFMYLMIPFTASLLGLGFYLVVRGGFFNPTTQAGGTSPYGFAAMAFVIGLYQSQALEKLKQIFETMFTTGTQGADRLQSSPTFRLEAKDPAPSAGAGPLQVDVTIRAIGGFTGQVNLDAEAKSETPNAPAVQKPTFDPSPINISSAGPAVSKLTITKPGVQEDTIYTVTITAKSAEITQTATIRVTVRR